MREKEFVPQTCVTFVSKASIETGAVAGYGLKKRVEAVKGCRSVGKKDMVFNDAMPKMRVDPERYVGAPVSQAASVVRALTCRRSSRPTVKSVPRSRRRSCRLPRLAISISCSLNIQDEVGRSKCDWHYA